MTANWFKLATSTDLRMFIRMRKTLFFSISFCKTDASIVPSLFRDLSVQFVFLAMIQLNRPPTHLLENSFNKTGVNGTPTKVCVNTQFILNRRAWFFLGPSFCKKFLHDKSSLQIQSSLFELFLLLCLDICLRRFVSLLQFGIFLKPFRALTLCL